MVTSRQEAFDLVVELVISDQLLISRITGVIPWRVSSIWSPMLASFIVSASSVYLSGHIHCSRRSCGIELKEPGERHLIQAYQCVRK
jgi:hypothetical protein